MNTSNSIVNQYHETVGVNQEDIIYINMNKKGDFYICNIDLEHLREIKIRRRIRRLMSS